MNNGYCDNYWIMYHNHQISNRECTLYSEKIVRVEEKKSTTYNTAIEQWTRTIRHHFSIFWLLVQFEWCVTNCVWLVCFLERSFVLQKFKKQIFACFTARTHIHTNEFSENWYCIMLNIVYSEHTLISIHSFCSNFTYLVDHYDF